MTKSDNTRAALATKTQQRQLKVKAGFYEYQDKQDCQQQSDIAEILLKGKWLAQAGFQAGEYVSVRVMHGCLVVTKKNNPDYATLHPGYAR